METTTRETGKEANLVAQDNTVRKITPHTQGISRTVSIMVRGEWSMQTEMSMRETISSITNMEQESMTTQMETTTTGSGKMTAQTAKVRV